MKPLFAALVLTFSPACASHNSGHESKWIEYGTTSNAVPAQDVQAFPRFRVDQQVGEPVTIEMPLHRSRVGTVKRSVDQIGYPAVTVVLDDRDAAAFEAYTAANVHRELAIVVAGKAVSVATIQEKLPGQFQIYGRFTDDQVNQLLKALQ